MNRILSPYELNCLSQHKMGDIDIAKYGEIPIEYIVGFAQFLGREFIINKNVLIPRLETEKLVHLAVNYQLRITSYELPIVIADIGTGTGCLGISLYLELAKKGIRSTVYLSDISKEALEIARLNVRLLTNKPNQPNLANQANSFKILLSDLFDDYPPNLKFDLIVANLPYIPTKRIKNLPSSVKNYEPLSALDGGPDGLLLIKKLISKLPNRLNKNGIAILEIDETHQLSDFSQINWGKMEIKKDQFNKNRFLTVLRHSEESATKNLPRF